jgi:hypothetical protein
MLRGSHFYSIFLGLVYNRENRVARVTWGEIGGSTNSPSSPGAYL